MVDRNLSQMEQGIVSALPPEDPAIADPTLFSPYEVDDKPDQGPFGPDLKAGYGVNISPEQAITMAQMGLTVADVLGKLSPAASNVLSVVNPITSGIMAGARVARSGQLRDALPFNVGRHLFPTPEEQLYDSFTPGDPSNRSGRAQFASPAELALAQAQNPTTRGGLAPSPNILTSPLAAPTPLAAVAPVGMGSLAAPDTPEAQQQLAAEMDQEDADQGASQADSESWDWDY